jgi:ribosomal subunit interface protein
MDSALQITFRDIAPSPAIETAIRERFAKLEHFGQRITRCHVSIESPHKHAHKGNAFRVRIDLAVPGEEEIVVDRGDDGHEDVYVAIKDAFETATRQIQHHAGKRRDSHLRG